LLCIHTYVHMYVCITKVRRAGPGSLDTCPLALALALALAHLHTGTLGRWQPGGAQGEALGCLCWTCCAGWLLGSARGCRRSENLMAAHSAHINPSSKRRREKKKNVCAQIFCLPAYRLLSAHRWRVTMLSRQPSQLTARPRPGQTRRGGVDVDDGDGACLSGGPKKRRTQIRQRTPRVSLRAYVSSVACV
jgi:hypothetical protein